MLFFMLILFKRDSVNTVGKQVDFTVLASAICLELDFYKKKKHLPTDFY